MTAWAARVSRWMSLVALVVATAWPTCALARPGGGHAFSAPPRSGPGGGASRSPGSSQSSHDIAPPPSDRTSRRSSDDPDNAWTDVPFYAIPRGDDRNAEIERLKARDNPHMPRPPRKPLATRRTGSLFAYFFFIVVGLGGLVLVYWFSKRIESRRQVEWACGVGDRQVSLPASSREPDGTPKGRA